MTQVFDGINVLDFTWGMAGSVATMVLSDFGAEVIKVEPPGGDPFRAWPASLQWNRGKKSVTLDLKTPEGRRQAHGLAQQADVVMESFRPGVTQRLGIDYETLSASRPDLVYCSLTGFGPKGPYAHYKGYEGVVGAKMGRMMAFASQNHREGPNYGAVQVASHSAAMALLRGVTAALMVRDQTGQGQKVETSLLQAFTPYDLRDWILWQMMIMFPELFPEDNWIKGDTTPGYLPVRTKDGQWIQMANIVGRLFRASMYSTGLGHIFDDPRFKEAPRMLPESWQALKEMMLERFQEKTLDEWMDIFVNQTADVAAEPFMTALQGMDHPQILYNGHIMDLQDPRVGRMRQLGPLVDLTETPGTIKGPAPDPGQHTQEVLGLLNGVERKAPSVASRPLPRYPLEGITVLDLTTVIAGPLGCCMIAELGARVIKIESLAGDWVRHNAAGIMAHRTMAGAEGLCLNLKTQEGQEVIQKLVAKADVLVHSMRPGAPERAGIGYDQLREINPRLIYVYTGGYGPTGPHSHRPSMHPIPGAVCGGALAQIGRRGLPPPEQPLTMEDLKEASMRLNQANQANPDQSASMTLAVGILFGLYSRERLGKPQYVVSTMLAANAYANADDFFWYEGKPPGEMPDADGYGLNALYRLYQAQKGWIFLACPFEEEWQALCRAIARPNLLEDPRFATREARRQHDEDLSQELSQVFATREPLEWEKDLTAADVACVEAADRGPYFFFNEDPHVQENGFTTLVESLRFGEFWRYSPLLTFSHTAAKAEPGVLKGQHSQTILEELGYSEEQVRDFKERGVVDWEEP